MLCTVVYPGKFVAWVTCLTAAYEESLITGMVKKGYIVGAAAANGKTATFEENQPSVVIAFTIDTYDETKKAKDIYNDLTKIIIDKKMYCYSVIVSAQVDASWGASNIRFPKPEEPPAPKTDSNLN